MDARYLDAGLHLLDRQIMDVNDRPVAKVDDLELSDDDVPIVTAILCGPAAWGPRLGGRLGRWIVALHHRLMRRGPVRIEWANVSRVHQAVDLGIPRRHAGAMELDDWVRLHFIARIPGARHAPD